MKLLRAPLAVALALGAMLAAGRAVDETKPYALACVTVVDAGEGKESELGGGLKPRAGLRLTVHLDANAEGEALIVALTRKTGQPAHGWRPVLVRLKEWAEVTAPPAGEPWVWTEAAEPFDVFVVFLAKDDPAAEAVRKAAAALRAPAADAAAGQTQARLLREGLQKWLSADTALAAVPAGGPVAIGGTVRNVGEFPWRELARKANFAAAHPGVLVFRAK